MFDELDKQNAQNIMGEAITPAPAKTEDIFSEVDKTVKPEPFRSRDSSSAPVSGTVRPAATGWLKNKLMIFCLIFGGLLVVLAGGYFGLKLALKGVVKEEIKNDQVKTETPSLTEPPSIQETNAPLSQPLEPSQATQPVDSDQDGLTDEEEAVIGANLNDPDTDQDGLTDREEVKVYGTDPLKADTDADGYADGAEIKNGFNPKGSGKLLDINK